MSEGLSKGQIRALFEKTRPHPHNEFVYLWHMVRAVQNCLVDLHKKKPNLEFPTKIRVKPCDVPMPPLVKVQDSIVIFHPKENTFQAKLVIAESLGEIVMQYIPTKLGNSPSDSNMVLYFAELILKLNINMENGAILRKHPYPPDAVRDVIMNLRPQYCPKNITKKDKVNAEDTLKKFFKGYPVVKECQGVLSCEVDLIREFLAIGLPNYRIEIAQSESLSVGPKEGTYSHISFFDNGCEIWHITLENLQTSLRGSPNEDCGVSIIRLAIAHELAHALLYETLNRKKDDDYVEREAAFLARVILERRELLYNGGKRDKNYHDACEKWAVLFRHVHKNESDEFIKWVLKDE